MNDYEKTILGKVLNIGGKLIEGAAAFGLFYNAFNPNQDSLRNAYLSASAGAAGICLDKLGDRILRYVDEIKQIREREKIQLELAETKSELEQSIIRENLNRSLPAETKPEERGKIRAEEYVRMQRGAI